MGAWHSMGKFPSRLAERCYDLANGDGADEQTGTVDESGWYALFHFRAKSVIIREDSQGFVQIEEGTRDEMSAMWATIEADYAAADTEADDDCDEE